MRELGTEEISAELRALFDPNDPASLRCFAVLNGHAAGRVFADGPADPTWGLVQEAGFGSIYLGGTPDVPALRHLMETLLKSGDVLVGLWPGDERFELLPPDPGYEGAVLEFVDLPHGAELGAYMSQVPPGWEVRRVDRELLERCTERDVMVAIYGSAEEVLRKSIGVCLMRGNEILCNAFAGPRALGLIELGVSTGERVRRRGYATITCAHLVRICDGLGYRTYWNCSKQNAGSVALARKLGYRSEREYRLLAWFRRE